MTEPFKKLNAYGKKRLPCVFIIDFKGENICVCSPEEAQKQGFYLSTSTYTNVPYLPEVGRQDFIWQTFPITLENYQIAYDFVHTQLMFGNSYLLNLSAPTRLKTNWDLWAIFQASKAKYKVYWKGRGEEEKDKEMTLPFTCFSPETFIQIRAGKIFSFPMKGTIDASIPQAEQIILQDEKELAEHYTIVDLIRNDLSQVAQKVRVERFRYIDTIQTHAGKTLLQVSSEVVGKLPKNYHAHIGDILAQLLPAGSISGAPKKKTLEIITEAEQKFQYQHGEKYQRGFYTGICGYFDGENLDTGVMIRFIEQVGEELYFKSGGGITTQSTLESEYHELIQKVYAPIA